MKRRFWISFVSTVVLSYEVSLLRRSSTHIRLGYNASTIRFSRMRFIRCRLDRCRFVLPLALILSVDCCTSFAKASQLLPYRTAAAILALTSEEAKSESPVTLRGVVTCSTDLSLYVHDKTAGIWIQWPRPKDFVPGDDVEIKGHTGPGLFSPALVAESIHKIGRAPLPRPKVVTLKRLLTGNEDAQYVRITGTIRAVELRENVSPAQRVWIKLGVDDGFIYSTLPISDWTTANQLIGSIVHVNATVSCTKTPNRQFTSVLLIMQSSRNLSVVTPPPADLFAVPGVSISKLMQYRSGTDGDHRTRVSGIVTYYRAGESLIIENGGRALLALTSQFGKIAPGDQVDVVGYPAPALAGPFLQDAVFRYIGQGPTPTPTRVTIADLASGTLNDNLVSIEGTLLQRNSEPHGMILLLQNGSTFFRAELADVKYATPLDRLRIGSRVRITGICVIDVEGSWNQGGLRASTVYYRILLRSPQDATEIQSPSWWTTLHVFYIAVVLGVLMFISFSIMLYDRMKRWRLEAVMNERERMAHEIHDTLAQSFAGIGFQLQAIRRGIPGTLADLRKQVDLACALVRHSHKEARRSLEPQHWVTLDNTDILSVLEECARRMVEGSSVSVVARCSGAFSHVIPAHTIDSLLRIGQEAIANSVRHANPHKLLIELAYGTDRVALAISDDGCGFIESGDLLGFGLRGMRRRSADISATLKISSVPGTGSRVEVICPLPSHVGRFKAFISRYSKHDSKE